MTHRLFDRHNRAATVAIIASVGIIAYNNLAVSAALPEVGNDLGDVALLPWTISVELLTSGVSVLLAGPLVDGLGARRVFRWSVSGFAITSFLCAVSPSMAWLIGARALQGVTAGLLMTVVTSAIGLAFAAELRPRVFAVSSSVWGVMSVAGPSIAASLVAVVGWRSVFVLNLPVTAFAAVVAWTVMPERQADAESARVDGRGITLIAIVSASALATVEGSLPTVAAGLMIGGVALWGYVRHANRAPHPVMRIRHIVDSRYRSLHSTAMLVVGAGLGAFAFLPVYMRGARGTSVTAAAFSIVFHSVGWSASAFTASRLQRYYANERIILGGSLIAAPMLVGAAVAVAVDAPLPIIFALLFGVGCGIGPVSSTGIATLQGRVPITEMGRIIAAHQFVRMIGTTYGVGLAGLVLLSTVDRRTGDVEAVRSLLGDDGSVIDPSVVDALAAGYGFVLLVTAALMTLSILSAVHLVRTSTEPVPSAP